VLYHPHIHLLKSNDFSIAEPSGLVESVGNEKRIGGGEESQETNEGGDLELHIDELDVAKLLDSQVD